MRLMILLDQWLNLQVKQDMILKLFLEIKTYYN